MHGCDALVITDHDIIRARSPSIGYSGTCLVYKLADAEE
jgi:hypothetical protein